MTAGQTAERTLVEPGLARPVLDVVIPVFNEQDALVGRSRPSAPTWPRCRTPLA